MDKLLTFPDLPGMALSVRAKALLFHDPNSVELLRRVEQIARSDATTLIIGETGTGKELIARHIHAKSARRGPFVAVNCGAFSPTLIDAELFGHEAGAFTGATGARPGWFEAANGGTLFLDEIGDLPQALQVKLLRVLQERQVVRLGARTPIPLNVRLVAATNVDLHLAVAANHFRADLYYRLSVATVHLPPLCERPGDILPLARHFIDLYSTTLKLDGVTLAPDAQLALLSYGWPGNIRELENVIHFALIGCSGKSIKAADLRLNGLVHRSGGALAGAALQPSAPSQPAHAAQPAPPLTPDSAEARLTALITSMLDAAQNNLFATVEQGLVQTAFERCNRNQARTAKALGLSRNVLRAHLKRFGLIGPSASDDVAAAAPQDAPAPAPAHPRRRRGDDHATRA
ncbi:MAG: sigma-54 interaction domain-containing protein [Gammaproteobacteria bacterium]